MSVVVVLVGCKHRHISGRYLSPPEKYCLRIQATKQFLLCKTLLANHSLALKNQGLTCKDSCKIHARWICLQVETTGQPLYES